MVHPHRIVEKTVVLFREAEEQTRAQNIHLSVLLARNSRLQDMRDNQLAVIGLTLVWYIK
jgi:hypothetical protein